MTRGRKREREREKVEKSEKRGLNGSNPLRILYLKRNAIDEMQTEFRSSAERSNRIKSNETQWSPGFPFISFLSLPFFSFSRLRYFLPSIPSFDTIHTCARQEREKKKNRFLPVVINSAFILSKSVEHGRFVIFIPSSFAINFFSCSLQYLQKKKKIEY